MVLLILEPFFLIRKFSRHVTKYYKLLGLENSTLSFSFSNRLSLLYHKRNNIKNHKRYTI